MTSVTTLYLDLLEEFSDKERTAVLKVFQPSVDESCLPLSNTVKIQTRQIADFFGPAHFVEL